MIRLIIPSNAVAKGRPRFARRGNKYSAIKTVCRASHKHDSKREAAKCDELHLALKAGYIKDLQFQVPFELSAFDYEASQPRNLAWSASTSQILFTMIRVA